MMTEDGQLLRAYRNERSEAAFGELVSRHIDLVYSTALRVVNGQSDLAQDVTQLVFIDLARQTASLPENVVLPGWLYRHTCFTASKTIRTERRRQAREQTSTEMNSPDDYSSPPWEAVAPYLDEIMEELNEADRDAVVLRFLQRQDLRAVGAALGISEDAAQKRVTRALEKLRTSLAGKGVTLTALALGSLISAQAVSAAPVGLAVTVTAGSLAATAGAAAGVTAIKVMTMTKLKFGIIGAVVLACVATPLAIQQQQAQAKLREENAALHEKLAALNRLAAENTRLTAETVRLSNAVTEAKSARVASTVQANEVLRLRGEVTRARLDSVANQKAAAPPPKPLAEMFQQPEMRAYIRAQQKQMFSSNVERNYADLFAKMALTPEQVTAAKDALLGKMMADADFGMSVMSGEMDGEKKAELFQKYRADKLGFDDKLKEAMGDTNYPQFEAFESTIPERNSASAFKDQLAGGGMALTQDQARQLTDAMVEERQAFKFTNDLTKLSSDESMARTMSEQTFNQYHQEVEQLNQRYLSRSQSILSPEQADAFSRYLVKSRELQKSMMLNFGKSFGPAAGK